MFKRPRIQNINYDSDLLPAKGREPARLTVRLKTVLVPMDPSVPYSVNGATPGRINLRFHHHLADSMGSVRRGVVRDGDGTPFRARSWVRREFDDYRIRFKQAVERAWNDQIILLPPEAPANAGGDGLTDAEYLALVGNPAVPAHVVGSLEVQLLPVQNNTQAGIQVVRLDRKEEPLGRRQQSMAFNGEGNFRALAWMLTNEDVFRLNNSDDRFNGNIFTQIPAAHEVGHWLGNPMPRATGERFLPHVDAEFCANTPAYADDPDCSYGHVASKRVAIMGAGSLVTEYDAQPWLQRVRRHTGALFGWRMMHRVLFRQAMPDVSARQKRLLAPQAAPATKARAGTLETI